MKKPALIFIRGLPGSGKSYLAERLVERLGTSNTVLLDPDRIDYNSEEYQALTRQLTEEGVDTKFHPYRFSRGRAHAGIKDRRVIIWNQAFTNLDGFQKTIANLTGYAAEQGLELPFIVAEVMIDPSIAKNRVSDRAARGGHDVPDENFNRFVGEYRSFAPEGYRTISIDGAGDIERSVEAVLAELEKL